MKVIETFINYPEFIYIKGYIPSNWNRKVIYFVHGATLPVFSGYDLKLDGKSFIDYFLDEGYACFYHDFRGTAKSFIYDEMKTSTKSKEAKYVRHIDVSQEIEIVSEFIKKNYDPIEYNGIGWSSGSTCLLMCNHIFDKIIFQNPRGISKTQIKKELPAHHIKLDMNTLKIRRISAFNSKLQQMFIMSESNYEHWANVVEPYISNFYIHRSMIIEMFNTLFKGDHIFKEKCDVPSLVIGGKYDNLTKIECNEQFFKDYITNGSFWVHPYGTHYMVVENHREMLINRIKEFLK